MLSQSPTLLFEEIGLKSWNASSSGEDPQVRRLTQDLSMPTRPLVTTGRIQDLSPMRILGGSLESVREERRQEPQQTSPEMEWLTEHAQELSQYRGQWLLISRQTLIAYSRDMGEIRRQITLHRIRKPFVYYVPTAEEANFIF